MKFLDEILREYFGGKIDISGRVKRRMIEKQGDKERVAAEDGASELLY